MKTFFRLQPAERRALMSPLGDAVAKIIYTGSSCEDFLLKFGWKHSLPGKKIDSYSFSLRLWSTRYQQQLIFLTNSSRLILSSMAKSSHLPALPSLLKGRFHSFPAKSIRYLPLSRSCTVTVGGKPPATNGFHPLEPSHHGSLLNDRLTTTSLGLAMHNGLVWF